MFEPSKEPRAHGKGFEGVASVTPHVQANGTLVIERLDFQQGVVSSWCPVAEPAWDGYVAWPANLARCRRG